MLLISFTLNFFSLKNKKIYLIAGEASGDLHGSNLMQTLIEEEGNIEFRFWGGDKMQKIGGDLVKHINELAFMGFIEVLMNLRTILKNISFCKKDIEAFQPDALILIDYPGFNLRIAEWAKSKGIKVYYYISPQVWAWKQNRVHKIKKVVDRMFVILPFEKEFYKKFNYDTKYVGHPLLDEIKKYKFDNKRFRIENNLDNRKIIAVLPGSRKQEVSKKLPMMLKALEGFNDIQIIIAGAPTLSPEFYKKYMNASIPILFGKTYELLSASELAVVTSGTATLETALLKTPEVVCYKGAKISYMIAKRLVKIDYISLVNLIMGKEIVKELIQDECTPETIKQEVKRLLFDEKYRSKMLKDFDELAKILGGGGASKRVAQSLLEDMNN